MTEFQAVATREARLSVVRHYEILDAPVDGSFERVAQVAATVFDVPIATVSIVDEDRVWFAATHGLDGVSQIGSEPGLCASAVLGTELYVVTDADTDPRTLSHPLVRGELGLRFYAAAPIVTQDGFALGTVNVIGLEPREATSSELAVLTQLAGIVAEHLDLRLKAITAVRAEQALRHEADERAEQAARLSRDMQEARARHKPVSRPESCELGGAEGCQASPELKVADSWGESAWGCVDHAEEALMSVSAVFIASEDFGGLTDYLDRGRSPGT